MTKFIYNFAMSLGGITFVLNLFRGKGIFDSFVSAALVFLGILFIMTIGGQILNWIMKMGEGESEEEAVEKKEKSSDDEKESSEEDKE